MLKIEIPGRESLELCHLVLDYNGTIAVDGTLLEPLKARLEALSRKLEIHVLTADTYGTVTRQCEGLPVTVQTFPRAAAGECKARIVSGLKGAVACLGNGYNDIPMFDLAALAVAVVMEEGVCAGLVSHADVLVTSAEDGLDLFLHPDRLRATLRS